MKFKLDHIHFRCQDLEAAIGFYQKMFGAEVTGRGVVQGRELVRLKIGDDYLFLSPKEEGANVQPLGADPHWGIYELGFAVDDTYQATKELKAKGAEFFKEAFEIRPGVQVAFMKAPDGVKIEILHRD